MDCTTPKPLVALGLTPVARWYGVSSMSQFFLLPTLQALCLFQKLGRTMMLLRGLCAARRLPFLYFQVCSAAFLSVLQCCGSWPPGCLLCSDIFFFNKLIKLVWIKHQLNVGAEYLAVSSVNKRPDRGSLLDKVYWLNYSVLESCAALSKNQRGSPNWTFCTVLWAMAHMLVVHIKGTACGGFSFGQICIWLQLLWIQFLFN